MHPAFNGVRENVETKMKTTINEKFYTITTRKMMGDMKGFMASTTYGMAGVHGFGDTRSKAVADLKNQIKNPV